MSWKLLRFSIIDVACDLLRVRDWVKRSIRGAGREFIGVATSSFTLVLRLLKTSTIRGRILAAFTAKDCCYRDGRRVYLEIRSGAWRRGSGSGSFVNLFSLGKWSGNTEHWHWIERFMASSTPVKTTSPLLSDRECFLLYKHSLFRLLLKY